MPSLPWEPHSTTETIWEESSYKARFSKIYDIYFMKLRSLSWAYLPEGTKNPGTTKGLNMRTCEDWKRTFKCWSRLTPYMRWVHSLHERHDISQQIPATRVPGLGKYLQESTYHMHKGYLVADGLWASICICKNSRIFFHSEHWEIRRVNSE